MTMTRRDPRPHADRARLPSLKISLPAEWLEELAERARESEHSLSAEGRLAVRHWLTTGKGARRA